MATVWGRLTQRAGVCSAPLGPGATNLVTGVADANLDRAPLVALTGRASGDRLAKGSHQVIDMVEQFRPVTRWNARIQQSSVIPEAVRKAFRLATSERKSACHLEIPEEVATEEASEDLRPLNPRWHPRHSPRPGEVKHALRLLFEADHPLIMAGNGVARGGASEALVKLAQKLQIPVALTFMGKGAIPADDKLFFGTVGLQAHDYAACGYDRADVMRTVGYDPVEYSPKSWNPGRDKRIAYVDFIHSEPDAHYGTEVEVVGDLTASLDELARNADFEKGSAYTRRLRVSISDALRTGSESDAFPLKPQRIVHDLREALEPDDVLVSDVDVPTVIDCQVDYGENLRLAEELGRVVCPL